MTMNTIYGIHGYPSFTNVAMIFLFCFEVCRNGYYYDFDLNGSLKFSYYFASVKGTNVDNRPY